MHKKGWFVAMHGKNARVRILSLFAIILVGLFMIGGAFAIYAFPAATGTNTVLVAQTCNNASNNAVAGAFTQSCNTSRLNFNDGAVQTSVTSNNNRYAGVNLSSFNSSITNCGSITQVKLCYEWWYNTNAISFASGACALKVDADGGASFTTVSTSCPNVAANPGESCLDVTSSENWVCSDFFTASGTRAQAIAEVYFPSSKTLSIDSLYFNITYTADTIAPTVDVIYPTNTTYTSNVTSLNFIATDDTNCNFTWYNINGTNSTPSACTSGSQVNVTGLSASSGSYTWYAYANDSFGYLGSHSHTFTVNLPPTISNSSVLPNPIAPSTALVIYANTSSHGVNDTEGGTLSLYCDYSNSPDTTHTICSQTVSDSSYPYVLNCSFNSESGSANYTKYCRVYDGVSYSSAVQANYTVNAAVFTSTIVSVAGDTSPSYFDTVDDSNTLIIISGESGMSCRWSSTDQSYSAMSNACTVGGTQANCSINNVASNGSTTRYISCKNSLNVEQTAANNLDVTFYLDYTAPNTTDNSVSTVQLPGYSVTITESDNVDSDPTTLYCISGSTCTPNLGVDNLGQVTFTTRGVNYLRYNSSDDAGNIQAIANKTININQLPIFTSATDNAVSILGGTTVTISTISSDVDSAQTLKLYVCNSSGVTSSGCTGMQYCSAAATANLSCGFASETDTATHTWYAYIMDALNESATTNPLTGFYSTDSSGPTITINDPQNTTYTQSSVSAQITTSEAAVWAGYSLDGANNTTMNSLSSTQFTATISGLSLGLHNITYYSNDSFGNMESSAVRYFTIAAAADIVAPTITIVTPSNLSYTTLTPLLNITADEALSWAGYTLNGGSLTNLTNTSLTSWNATLSLSQESTNTVIIYANDTSNNQVSKTLVIYADSRAPRYYNPSAPSTNQFSSVNCSIVWNDTFALTNVLIGENSSGSFENHTIALTSNGTASYIIVESKLANAGTYSCQFYASDAAGTPNSTSISFTVSDVTAPTLTVTSPGNFTYNQNSIGISLVTNENASSAWYSLNGAANVSMGNTSKTSWNATLTSLSNAGYNIKFYANDSSGNIGNSSLIYFTVNSISDTILPVITMVNPPNLSYKNLSEVLNISSNEALLWAGYTLNGGNLTNLTNTSLTSWNATLSLSQESTNTLVIYANDTASPNNQANFTITFYSDTLAPRYSAISAPSTNQSQSVNCSIAWNDTFALTNVLIGENSSGSFENHTIALTSNGTASYIIVGSKLANKGNYTCEFYASDAAGNKAYNSTVFSINDVDSPIVTVTSPSAGTYNQQNISLSVITNENTSLVWYSFNGTNVSLTSLNNRDWSGSLGNLLNGTYYIQFYANDSSGNLGNSTNFSFSINTGLSDTIPPVIAITSLANASYYRFLSDIALNITVNENVSEVNYSLNGAANVSMTNTSMFNWNATLSGLTEESTNNLSVYANDTAGRIGSSTIVFYADTLAPRFSLEVATSTNETQNVNCTAYINDTFNLSSVKISENTTNNFINHTIDLFSTGYANYTIYNVARGNYTCIFYATDLAGNTNSTSKTFTVSDVTAPVITITSPSNATYGESSIVASIVTSEATVWAGYSLDGANNQTMTTLSAVSWSKTLSALSKASHNITFYANDSSGNIGNSQTIYFTVAETDTVPPVLSSTITNASYKNSLPVLFNVSSNENLAWAGCNLNTVDCNLTNLSSILWNGTLSGLVSGSNNTLIIYGNDSAGNQGNSTIIFYFDNESSQFTEITANAANETQNVTCNAYVNDSFGFSSVKISENSTINGVMQNHTIDLSSAGYANYTIYNVIKGSYSCIFYATDVAGNTNSTSKTFIVSDVTAPTLTITNPQNQTYNTENISLSVVTSEAASSAWYSLNGAANVTMTNSSSTIWIGSLTNKENEFYTVVYYANDSSGNLGIANVSFSIDTTLNDNAKPLITIWSPLNGTYYTDSSILLNMTSDKNLSWAGYSINGSSVLSLTNTSLTSWNATPTFVEGTNNVTFYANDTSTNRNQGNRTVFIYVDLSNPEVTSFNCDSSVNDSSNLTCNASVSDAIGLDYAILSYNFSGSFVNSSEIDLSGTSTDINYLFTEGNYSTPGNYTVQLYLFDLAGRMNDSSSDIVHVLDDVAPVIDNYTYSPSDFDALDPGVTLIVNASVTEDYSMGSVYLMYKNETDSGWNFVLMTNTTLTDYNTSFTLPSGNVTIKINASDSYGNVNISYNTTFEVALDISQSITTNISSIVSFTYAQRTSSNELGYLILNTTSDSGLTYNVTISAASELSRFNLNNTLNQSENYTAGNGTVLYLPVYVNLTGLTSGLYPFNITVTSAAGVDVLERNLNVQSASGPYLSVSIDSYSSRVTRGETDVEFSATVTNLGTADAQGVYLNWTLPSGFTLVSGSLDRSLATLPVGVSGANTITLDVSSNVSVSNLTIYATASSTNADSSNSSKVVAVTNPLTVTQVVEVPGPSTGGSGGGGGAAAGGGGGGAAVTYFKTIEVVRGNRTSFTIDFGNNKVNKTLTNVVMSLTGFPEKYMQITPSSFANVYYGENKSFEVLLNAPTYKSYEEHVLKVVIKGTLVSGNSQESYIETQNIRLIIQEISHEAAAQEYNLANSSINEMKQKGYNTAEMEQLYNQARNKLDVDFHNKESYDISAKIIGIKETAYKARKLIDTIRSILVDPDKINLLTGNVVMNDSTQNVIFYSKEISDILDMADSAFERGDYTIALERAQKAELILRLEQKGNVLVFFYLYWPQMLFALVFILIVGKIVYNKYSRNKISSKIKDLNREEENINNLMSENQNKYYSAKISSSEYHARANQYHNRLANLRKSRINLRNKRIKVLAPEEFVKELDGEKKEVEQEVMKIQKSYYRTKNISEEGYKSEFNLLNNRLAEIEDERIVVDVNKNHEESKKKGFFSSFFAGRNARKEQELKSKIDKLIKSKEKMK